jgi:exopolysaccharide biosynthesis polyprenyl glycosylphosphotransferase
MLQQQVYVINTVLMVFDAVCVILAGYGAYYLKQIQAQYLWGMDTSIFVGSILLVMFMNNYFMGKFGLYDDSRKPSYWLIVVSIMKAVFVTFASFTVAVFLYRQLQYSRVFLIVFALLSLVFLTLFRVLVQYYFNNHFKKGFSARRILVVGDKERSGKITDVLNSQLSYGHEIVGRLAIHEDERDAPDTLGCLLDFDAVLRKQAIDEVVFAMSGDRMLNLRNYLDVCRKMGIPTRILPALWKEGDRVLFMETLQGVPFLTMRTANFNATGLVYKRILDLIGGTIGTLIFLLLYPFVAAAIKLDSPGPVLFKQKRMGRNGRIFDLYKFRSMHADAEARKQELLDKNVMNGALFKMADDPRITKVGRWMRKTSVDEIPQFINVLKGEMSLVGTRPPTLDEVEKYQPQHLKRISAKPGLTGLWQISGRNKITDFEEVVELDCHYLDQWRFSNDIKILAKTILIVLQRKGAV